MAKIGKIMNGKISTNKMTVIDRIGMVYVVSNILGLLLFPRIANAFSGMFQDFGGELPVLTLLVLNPWFSIQFAVSGAVVFCLQWHKGIKTNIKQRRLILIIAFVIVVTATMVCVIGLYLPILAMSEALG